MVQIAEEDLAQKSFLIHRFSCETVGRLSTRGSRRKSESGRTMQLVALYPPLVKLEVCTADEGQSGVSDLVLCWRNCLVDLRLDYHQSTRWREERASHSLFLAISSICAMSLKSLGEVMG